MATECVTLVAKSMVLEQREKKQLWGRRLMSCIIVLQMTFHEIYNQFSKTRIASKSNNTESDLN